jgi:trimeric autotransporter adhesin
MYQSVLCWVAILFFNILLFPVLSEAQSPEKYNYQAVVRDSGGQVIVNTEIGMRIRIREGGATGSIVYEETHLPFTNQLGLVNIHIGTGVVQYGIFSSVDWGTNTYFQETEIDFDGSIGGLNYVLMGTTELVSVPYAFYAKQAGGGWSLIGNSGTNPGTHFIGTTDSQSLHIRVKNLPAGQIGELNTSLGVQAGANNVNGMFNDAFGINALINNTDGNDNVAVGTNSLYNNLGSGNTAIGRNTLRHNQIGFSNTAIGTYALFHNVYPGNLVAVGDSALFHNNQNGSTGIFDGLDNTAVGSKSLFANTTGSSNTGLGMNSLYNNESGVRNTALGKNALLNNVIGVDNTAVGFEALRNNTTGINTSVGSYSMYSNTSGNCNSSLGYFSMHQNTTGVYNIAAGCLSLLSNTTGSGNTAIGAASAYSNTTGNGNVAIGNNALYHSQTRSNLVAIGDSALFHNGVGAFPSSSIDGGKNIAIGAKALKNNTTGWNNTGIGYQALISNTTGMGNTALGINALYANTIGAGNVAIGENCMSNNLSGQLNVAIGDDAMYGNTTGWYNTGIGVSAGGNANSLINSVAVGYASFPNNSNVALLGNTTTTSCGGYANWSNFSDGRFKKMVKENVVGLDFINSLRPVTYQIDLHGLNQFLYQDKTDEYERAMSAGIVEKGQIIQSGFIAQEVVSAAQQVGYNFDGVITPNDTSKQHYSLSYASFVVPLVKAVQEQQLEIEANQKALARQKQLIEIQEQTIETLKSEVDRIRRLVEK